MTGSVSAGSIGTKGIQIQKGKSSTPIISPIFTMLIWNCESIPLLIFNLILLKNLHKCDSIRMLLVLINHETITNQLIVRHSLWIPRPWKMNTLFAEVSFFTPIQLAKSPLFLLWVSRIYCRKIRCLSESRKIRCFYLVGQNLESLYGAKPSPTQINIVPVQE